MIFSLSNDRAAYSSLVFLLEFKVAKQEFEQEFDIFSKRTIPLNMTLLNESVRLD